MKPMMRPSVIFQCDAGSHHDSHIYLSHHRPSGLHPKQPLGERRQLVLQHLRNDRNHPAGLLQEMFLRGEHDASLDPHQD